MVSGGSVTFEEHLGAETCLCPCRHRARQRLPGLSGRQEPRRETMSTPHPQRPAAAQLLPQEHGTAARRLTHRRLSAATEGRRPQYVLLCFVPTSSVSFALSGH